jgi:hypothetical protein
MNVGDLVTLSARGKKLEACWRWDRSRWRNRQDAAPTTAQAQLVGLIIAIEEPQFSYDQQRKYIVSWINEGPAHREPYNYGRKTGHWHRSDLKFVAKAK